MADIVVYTTRTCSYCGRVKQLLTRLGLPFQEVDVSFDDDKREWLVTATGGQTTVPQVFIDGRSVGGYTDLITLERAGELSRLK